MIIRRGLRTSTARFWREAKKGQKTTLLDGDVFWRNMAFTDWAVFGVIICGLGWAASEYQKHREHEAIMMHSANPYFNTDGKNLGDLGAMQLYRLEQDAKFILKQAGAEKTPIEAERRD